MTRWILPIALLAATAAGCTAPHPELALQDVTRDAGLNGERYSGSTLHNLGVNWIDFDGDGWPDIFAVNGDGGDAHLYRNLGDGTFEVVDELLPELARQEMAGAAFADYDNDGDPDIYIQITHEQFELFGDNEPDGPPNVLLQNQWVENGEAIVHGEPLFVDVAADAGVDDLPTEPLGATYPGRRGMTGGWIDFDRDGCVDLFVGNMTLQLGGHPSNRSSLYRNLCDGTFEDVTVAARVNRPGDGDPFMNRPALAWFGGHLDDDLWPDMYVVNVHEPPPHHNDLVFMNQGDSTFREVTEVDASMPGIGDDSGGGMGIDVGDLDLDGDFDIYIADIYNTTFDADPKGNVLYWGNGDGTWADNVAPEAGVEGSFSWGVSFFDLDRDGYEEIFVATTERPNHLYQNMGDGTFVDVAVAVGVKGRNVSRGSAIADYDRDGDVDLLFVNNAGTLKLYRNESAPAGGWLSVELEATESNGSAIGALVKVTLPDGTLLQRQVKGGSSAHSQDELTLHFGLGSADRIESLEVLWPSGIVDTRSDVDIDQFVVVREGD